VYRTCASTAFMLSVPGSSRAASTPGMTRSTTSRTNPPGVAPLRSVSSEAATAPHESCPSTTTSGTSRNSTAYSMLPSTSGPITCPAVRITNRSPRPWSKMISAASRESEQPNSTANGRCPGASAARRPASWFGCTGAPATNRPVPASSCVSASTGVACPASCTRPTTRSVIHSSARPAPPPVIHRHE
jgi:hypothetical protein